MSATKTSQELVGFNETPLTSLTLSEKNHQFWGQSPVIIIIIIIIIIINIFKVT